MSRPPIMNRRLTRKWQPLIRTTTAICIVVLLVTTAALFCSVDDYREGTGKGHSTWVQPQAAVAAGPWMSRTRIVGQITPRSLQKSEEQGHRITQFSAGDMQNLQEFDDTARIKQILQAASGNSFPVLNSAPPVMKKFCMYSERNSGSNWVSSLIEANFQLKYDPSECPHKHDLGMSVPNEFSFLPANVLVVAVFRNAFDWTASMHRHPWHATNHCNTSSFAEFLVREWSPGKLAGRPNWLHPAPFCPRYDTNRTRMPMIYENIGGVHASNILELRTWKAARALEVCQTRKQSVCVRHEDLIENTKEWLVEFQKQFNFETKPDFPIEVVSYKGVRGREKFIPHSEYSTMRFGQSHSPYYNDETMETMRKHLDLALEEELGYFYTDIFQRWLDPDLTPFRLPDEMRIDGEAESSSSELNDGDRPPDTIAASAEGAVGGGRKIMQPLGKVPGS
ncbi:hypothetical protein COCOBI_09-5330 [Coccomyxa sp. Obi]|nr:hypothetical protein COCOBI_09-5330 [Coccomyxa sp. Obi]